jgi:hypothetical protein
MDFFSMATNPSTIEDSYLRMKPNKSSKSNLFVCRSEHLKAAAAAVLVRSENEMMLKCT